MLPASFILTPLAWTPVAASVPKNTPTASSLPKLILAPACISILGVAGVVDVENIPTPLSPTFNSDVDVSSTSFP